MLCPFFGNLAVMVKVPVLADFLAMTKPLTNDDQPGSPV